MAVTRGQRSYCKTVNKFHFIWILHNKSPALFCYSKTLIMKQQNQETLGFHRQQLNRTPTAYSWEGTWRNSRIKPTSERTNGDTELRWTCNSQRYSKEATEVLRAEHTQTFKNVLLHRHEFRGTTHTCLRGRRGGHRDANETHSETCRARSGLTAERWSISGTTRRNVAQFENGNGNSNQNAIFWLSAHKRPNGQATFSPGMNRSDFIQCTHI